MTPFGEKMRELRAEKGVTQKQMAKQMGVTPAYLSALENGKRGAPSWAFLQSVIGYFNIIWDDAEELQKLAFSSHPRVTVDTSELSADATRLANYLAQNIAKLTPEECRLLMDEIQRKVRTPMAD